MRKLLNTIYVTNEQMYLMLDGGKREKEIHPGYV